MDSQDVPERRHSVTPKKSIEDGIDKGKWSWSFVTVLLYAMQM